MHKEWYDYDATLGECTQCGDSPCTCGPGMIWLGAGGKGAGSCTHRGGHKPFCKGVIQLQGIWIALPIPFTISLSTQCAECGCTWAAHSLTSNNCANCCACKVFTDTKLIHAGGPILSVPGWGTMVISAPKTVTTVMALPHSIEYIDLKFTLDPLKCECGQAACGTADFAAGHSTWCPVFRK